MSAILGRKKEDFTEDSASAKEQYTSFEGAKGDRHRQPLATDDSGGVKSIALDNDACIAFFGRNDFLSNFFDSAMLIAGHSYPTVEHYYEACKVYALAGPYQAMYLKGATNPGHVKTMVKRIAADAGIPRRAIEKWKRTDGLLVMRVGLMEKYRQNPSLREQLLKTGDCLLVQTNQYDNLWSVGMEETEFRDWLKAHAGQSVQYPAIIDPNTIEHVPDLGKGKNLLGFLTMYVRDCLRNEFGLGGRVETLMKTESGADVPMDAE